MSVVSRSPLVCVAFGRVADVADDGAKQRVEHCCELDRLREGVPEAKVRAFVLDHRSEFGIRQGRDERCRDHHCAATGGDGEGVGLGRFDEDGSAAASASAANFAASRELATTRAMCPATGASL